MRPPCTTIARVITPFPSQTAQPPPPSSSPRSASTHSRSTRTEPVGKSGFSSDILDLQMDRRSCIVASGLWETRLPRTFPTTSLSFGRIFRMGRSIARLCVTFSSMRCMGMEASRTRLRTTISLGIPRMGFGTLPSASGVGSSRPIL